MMWRLVAALMLVPLAAAAQVTQLPHGAPAQETQQKLYLTDGPVSFAVFESRIAAAAGRHPTAARFVYFEYTMPGDEEEYEEMGKYGLLVIAAFSRNQGELPLVALKVGDLELRCIGQVDRSMPDGAALRRLGAHRVDAFYLVPVAAMKQDANLWAVFGGNHGFTAGTLNAEGAIDAIRNDRNPAPTHDPVPDALKDLAQREYPGFGIEVSP